MPETTGSSSSDFDAIVVGAGFAGLYAIYRLRELGLAVQAFEAGSGIGGTWFWNCYPGARCDVESLDYSYSFSEELEQEWSWSERYPSQPEILRYLEHVADRFELWPSIRLETRVTAATFDESSSRWTVTTNDGARYTAQYCVMATGCLSAAQVPDLEGLDRFEGVWFHTGNWPREGVDLSGKRVGVIGTGSTGIQVIPELVEEAEHVTVFQRTANFSVPSRNAPMDPEFERRLKARYPEFRRAARKSFLGVSVEGTGFSALEVDPEERARLYQSRWDGGGGMPLLVSYNDLLVDREANDTLACFVRAKIREAVDDPDLADLLTPRGFPIGTKRLCQHSEYYEIYNRDDVTLVDVRRSPIQEITATGVRTSDAEYALDAIVFATGFDAVTGALLAIDIRGRGGLSLRETWAAGPRTYLGVAIAGFPNFFIITGPGSPSVLSNMVVSIEQHVDWIADCIACLRERGVERLEATQAAEDAWVAHVDEVGESTLFPLADSWYVGANIPGKPRVFLPYVGGVGTYRKRCDEVAANGYEGFALKRTSATERPEGLAQHAR
jgi:cation diffusion facilitator CzcD-associated flavoprotein CzcO